MRCLLPGGSSVVSRRHLSWATLVHSGPTGVVCGALTRPWPPFYLRLASTIRHARRAVDEQAAGAGLREDLAGKAPPNPLSPYIILHTCSLCLPDVSPCSPPHLSLAFPSPLLTGCLFLALDTSCILLLPTQNTSWIELDWTGLDWYRQTSSAYTLYYYTHANTPRQHVLRSDHSHTRVSHGTMTFIVDISHYIVLCL